MGIDQRTWEQAKPYLEDWGSWIPSGYSEILPELKVASGFLPFDYSVHAWMADREALEASKLPATISVRDLLRPRWKRNLLLQDPRTSTPGLAFLLYTEQVLGAQVWEFWRALRSQWLTLAPGWDAAYSMFLRKEAPLVWSYTTSQAYHVELGKPGTEGRYFAVLFEEGQPVQIEGAALIKGGVASDEQRKLARKFLEFLISPEVQKRIPLKNWMLPVRRNTVLPESFKNLPQPKRIVKTPVEAARLSAILSAWGKVVSGAGAK